jgi:hypothetical protein
MSPGLLMLGLDAGLGHEVWYQPNSVISAVVAKCGKIVKCRWLRMGRKGIVESWDGVRGKGGYLTGKVGKGLLSGSTGFHQSSDDLPARKRVPWVEMRVGLTLSSPAL